MSVLARLVDEEHSAVLAFLADGESAFDPASGTIERSIDVAAQAGTAFDGRHLFQIAEP